MTTTNRAAWTILAVAGLSLPVPAQNNQPAGGRPPAPSQPARPAGSAPARQVTRTPATILSVKGAVKYQEQPGGPWIDAKAGAVVSQGVRFQVSLRSAVEILVGATQRLTVDRLSSFVLSEAVNDGGVHITRAQLDYGRVLFDVDSTKVANSVTIEAPDATLAISGTSGGMEVTPGQPTRAFGGDLNTGKITVQYPDGTTAQINRDEATDAANPDPASNQSDTTVLDTAEPRAREAAETEVVARSTGGGESYSTTIGLDQKTPMNPMMMDPGDPGDPGPGPGPEPGPPTGDIFYAFDRSLSAVRTFDLEGRTELVHQGAFPDSDTFFDGLALRDDPVRGRQAVLLRSGAFADGDTLVAVNRLYTLDLDRPDTGFVLFEEYAQAGQGGVTTFLEGLASLGNTLYASGSQDFFAADAATLYELSPGAITPLLAIPSARFQGGLGGSNERGSLFILAEDFDAELEERALLEIDPRTSYLASAYTEASGAFEPTPDSILPAGFDFDDVDEVTGIAYVNGTVVFSAIAAVVGPGSEPISTNVLIQYNPAATNAPGDPRIRRVDAVEFGTVGFLNALASETSSEPIPPVQLINDGAPIDTTSINALFAGLAYSEQAFNTGIVERMVSREILDTAIDPTGCRDSGALSALPGILQRNINRTSGVGRAVGEFRASLPTGHPCNHTDF